MPKNIKYVIVDESNSAAVSALEKVVENKKEGAIIKLTRAEFMALSNPDAVRFINEPID